MDNFYDINLFSQKFSVDGELYKVLLQTYIQIEIDSCLNILVLLQEAIESKILIIACDLKAHALLPVPVKLVNTIINAIKQIPFEDIIQNRIDGICNLEDKPLVHPEKVDLGFNVFILAGTKSITQKKVKIELEMIEHIRINATNFIFGAFDGINTYVYFKLKSEELDSIRDWGILSGVKVLIDNEFMGEYFPQETLVINNNELSVLCQTKASAILGTRILGGLRMDGVNVYDISDFITSSAGLFNTVAYPEGYPKTQNWYTVIIPVRGLSINSEFGIGSVQFLMKNNEEIARIISFEEKFSQCEAFALVHINSEKPYAAYMAARKQIEQAIDLTVNVLKDDSIFSVHAIGNHLRNVNIYELERKIALLSLVYIECPQTNARFSCDLAELDSENTLAIPRTFLMQKDEIEKAELLLIKANGTNDKEITPLFNALKWIRKAWDTDDYDGKIINAVIALEFIVSKEKNNPMMDKSLRRKCKKSIEEIVQQTDDIINKEDFLKKALEKFDRTYTETPFMLKLRNLMDRLEIPIFEKEMELIASARKRRNGIIHGENDSQLPTDDIYRLCECISKIAFYKINSLEI